jgi:hypothetical protein
MDILCHLPHHASPDGVIEELDDELEGLDHNVITELEEKTPRVLRFEVISGYQIGRRFRVRLRSQTAEVTIGRGAIQLGFICFGMD